MDSRHVVLVTVLTLLACIGHVSASTVAKFVNTPDFPATGHALTEDRNDAPTMRLLRTGNLASEDTDERIIGLDQITKAAKSATATIRQKLNLRTWLKEGQSADNVANLLNLDDKVDSVLSNPNFNALAKYISKFNKRNPEKKVSMIEVLTNRYGEPAVSKMLVAAKNVESRKVWATKLQGDQVAGWINSEKTAVDVFKILKLDDAATLPLKTRNLEAWENYVTILTKRKLGPATTMFETFRNVYKDDGLAKLIETSKMQVGVGPVAMDLKTSLFTSWKTEKITKSTISTKIFGLKNGDDGDKVTKLIIAQYKEYLKTGSLYLVKGTR